MAKSKRSPYDALREEAWAANMEIPTRGMALYTWGNVSAFDPALGAFAIKPSGVPYDELTRESMVVVDLDGNVLEGTLRPSSDTPTHLVIYRDFAVALGSSIRGVIHTHSTHAVAWAQACRSIPLFGTTHADHLQTAVPCTPYLSRSAVAGDYELETGKLIAASFGKAPGALDPDEVPMVLVGGHGPFAWGASAAKAVYNGVVLEEIARMATLTLQINPRAKPLPEYIVKKHYLRKHGPGSYYGQDGR